jgi:hypothetical protein
MIKLTKSTKKVGAVFLATVLIAGIVALSSQSSFMTTGKDAQNKPFYGNLNIKAAYASSEESDDEERDGDHKERDGDHKERDGDHKERDRDKEKDNNYNSFESIIVNKLDNNDDKKSYGMDSYESTDYQDDKVKKYNRYGSTDYGMDNDRESYDKKSYGNDYGYESQYSSYGKDDNRDKFKDSSKNVDIKKVKCKNINININTSGGSGTTTNGNTTNGNGDNGNKTDGFKKIDRDGFSFICINNNNNIVAGGETPPTPPPVPPVDECLLCFEETTQALRDAINTFLAEQGVIIVAPGIEIPANVNNFEDLCDWLTEEAPLLLTQEQINDLIAAFASATGQPEGDVEDLVDCLIDAGLIEVVPPEPPGNFTVCHRSASQPEQTLTGLSQGAFNAHINQHQGPPGAGPDIAGPCPSDLP